MHNCPYGFEIYFSKRQNHKDDCPNFCGLLRKAALYLSMLIDLEEAHLKRVKVLDYLTISDIFSTDWWQKKESAFLSSFAFL